MRILHKLAAAVSAAAVLCAVTSAEAAQTKANVFYYSLNDMFVNQLSAQMRTCADQHDVKLSEYDATDDLAKQISQIQMALLQNKDPLIVNPVDALNGEAALRYAKRAGVPVIFFNRKPSDNALASYDKAWYVGTDSAKAGEYQAEILIDYLHKHPEADRNKDGKIEYVILKGEAMHQDTQTRTSAFIRTMMDSGIAGEPLYSGNANWSYTQALEMMKDIISRNGIDKIEAVICNNDAMALGVLSELQSLGYNQQGKKDKFIPVIGIDATPRAIAAVSRGEMIGTVLNDANAIADICVKIAHAYGEGKPVTEDLVGLPIRDRQIDVPYVKYSMK